MCSQMGNMIFGKVNAIWTSHSFLDEIISRDLKQAQPQALDTISPALQYEVVSPSSQRLLATSSASGKVGLQKVPSLWKRKGGRRKSPREETRA